MPTETRKPGPGPRGPFENKRQVLTTRITEATRAALQAASEATGRSLSQEIEVRLEASFRADKEARVFSDIFYGTELASLLELVGKAMRDAGSQAAMLAGAGRTDWLDSRTGYQQAVLAALEVLRTFSPTKSGFKEHHAQEELGTIIAKKLLGALAGADASNHLTESWAIGVHQRLGKLRKRIAAGLSDQEL